MSKFLARLFCSHRYEFAENIYGDRINMLGARSIWTCAACGKRDYRQALHDESKNCAASAAELEGNKK